MASKRALITGISGQDGSYLAELLLKKGYEVHGLIRRSSRDPFVRLQHIKQSIVPHYGDLRDRGALERAVSKSQPDEVYNLAAQSDVGISFMVPEETYEINYAGVGRLAQVILDIKPSARLYQASTSEMFGDTLPPQSETSPFNPVSPYGIAKLRAHEDYVVGYREKRGVFIASGILFNHESPRRGEHFVTRKVTISFAKIAAGIQESVELGNLDAKRDWGFAGDYVDAMWRMMQRDVAEDYVIGTGKAHSVRELVEECAKAFGLKLHWEGSGVKEVAKDDTGTVRVRINEKFYRPKEVNSLLADAHKAERDLKWKPETTFRELVTMMAESDRTAQENRATH